MSSKVSEFWDWSVSDGLQDAINWHLKQAAICKNIADDDPRISASIRSKAAEAAKHHLASAAGLRELAKRKRS